MNSIAVTHLQNVMYLLKIIMYKNIAGNKTHVIQNRQNKALLTLASM